MLKIFIPGGSLLSWSGGIDFLKYILNILDKIQGISVIVGIPVEQIDQRFFRNVKNVLKRVIGRKINTSTSLLPSDNFFEQYSNVSIVCHRKKSFPKEAYQADIVFLENKIAPKIDRQRIIGYIPDLQHIHLPHLFSKKKRNRRNGQFTKVLKQSGTVFINSIHTQQDIKNKYPDLASRCEFFSMKFLPLISNFEIDKVDISSYNLPQRYFLISNQLWIHKDHPTAIRAIAELTREDRYSDVELLCTGKFHDFRNPDYYPQIQALIDSLGIKEKVRFLGYIPKKEQLAILRKAVATIQPTLFEGGPGGGATYDAVACGVQAIISDIEINKEIKNTRVHFFKVGNSNDLAEKMKTVLDTFDGNLTMEQLRNKYDENIFQAKKDLEELFKRTTQTLFFHPSTQVGLEKQ